MIESVH